MAEPILSIRNVSKRYAGKTAVDGVSLDIPEGRIFGLLGPNGAGKTSLIRMITSITAPDEGEILFRGLPMSPESPEQIGYMPEERGLYRKMKVEEHLVYLFRLRGLDTPKAKATATQWLEKLGLAAWAAKSVGDLSKGMQQKVQFIATIGHNPPLLILDEPFSGLDPINASVIEDEIREKKKNGVTIIFSTHRMEQVEEFCDEIGLINNGRLVLHDEVKAARKKYFRNQWFVSYEGDAEALRSLPGTQIAMEKEGSFLFDLEDGLDGKQFMKMLSATDASITKVEAHLPSLTEIFRTVVEKEASHA